jgi:hypothetical protein
MTTNTVSRYCICALALVILVGLAGCAGNYGKFNRDEEVWHAFENNQLRTDYKYFHNSHHNTTYAILGLDPKYRLQSKFWREVEPNTEEFRDLAIRLWEDYNRYRYGANLLDPAGTKIGVWYSSVYIASIRFYGDNQVEVNLLSPWLGGPDGQASGIRVP